MTIGPLKTTIIKERQRYYDEAVYCRPIHDPVAKAVHFAINPEGREPQPVILGYRRMRLRWMTTNERGEPVERVKWPK